MVSQRRRQTPDAVVTGKDVCSRALHYGSVAVFGDGPQRYTSNSAASGLKLLLIAVWLLDVDGSDVAAQNAGTEINAHCCSLCWSALHVLRL